MGRVTVLSLAAAAFSLAVAPIAFAADLPAPVPVKAPPPPPVVAPSWTGLYVGVGLGARWTEFDGSVLSATNDGGNILCTGGVACPGANLHNTAFRASGYLGYNW